MGRLHIGLILALGIVVSGNVASVALAADSSPVASPPAAAVKIADVKVAENAVEKTADKPGVASPAAVAAEVADVKALEKTAEKPVVKPSTVEIDKASAKVPDTSPVKAAGNKPLAEVVEKFPAKGLAKVGERLSANAHAVALAHVEAGNRYIAASLEKPVATDEGAEPTDDPADSVQMNLELALGEFEQAVQADPEFFEAQLALGRALSTLKRPGDAADAFAKACALHPTDGRAFGLLAHSLRTAGRIDEAVVAYDRAAVLAPLDRQVLEPLAMLHEQRSNWSAAADVYRRLRVLERNDVRYLRGLSHCLIELGQDRVALAILANLIRLDPADADSRVRVAQIENRLGRHQKAAAILREIVGSRVDDVETNLQFGIALVALGDRHARIYLETALRHAGKDPRVLLAVSDCYDRLLTVEESVVLLEKLRRAKLAEQGLEVRLALRYLLVGRVEDAIKLYQVAAKKQAPLLLDRDQRWLWLAIARGNRGAADELLARRLPVTAPGWDKRCAETLLGRCTPDELVEIAATGATARIDALQMSDAWLTIGMKADADRSWKSAQQAYQQFLNRSPEPWSEAVLFAHHRVRSLAAMN